MALQAFTDNFADNSTESGFQFTFFCAICNEGYKTKFIESKSNKTGKLLKGLGGLMSAAATIAGKYNIGSGVDRGAQVLSERFEGMSAEWQKEHDAAFEKAQAEARAHFHRCPKCTQWVCENDYNEQENLCTQCAPRENVEVAAARAKKKSADIEAKAGATQVFSGEIEAKQTLCPACGKPAGTGKFCNNCGESLALKVCKKCGAKNQGGTTAFCGECGEKL